MESFDQRVAALMAQVREVYSGRILMSAGVHEFDFPDGADLIGITTYDTGHPDLPPSATVDEWREAYDARFAETVDRHYERWGQPVVFYQLHVPSRPTNGDPTGEYAQARQLDGLLQVLEGRHWVVGSLAWAHHMIDAPREPGDGFRGRLAEAVLARFYASR